MKLLCSGDMCYALLSVGLLRKFEAYLVYVSLIWNKKPSALYIFSKITPFYLYVAMFSPCHSQFSRANWWHAQSFFSSVMAATFRDTVVVVAAVVRTRPRAIPLAMITIRKSICKDLWGLNKHKKQLCEGSVIPELKEVEKTTTQGACWRERWVTRPLLHNVVTNSWFSFNFYIWDAYGAPLFLFLF